MTWLSRPGGTYPAANTRGPVSPSATGMICSDLRDDTFWPHPSDHEGIAAAKAICGECPQRAPCLEEAIGERDWWESVRGGLTGDERRALARSRRRSTTKENR